MWWWGWRGLEVRFPARNLTSLMISTERRVLVLCSCRFSNHFFSFVHIQGFCISPSGLWISCLDHVIGNYVVGDIRCCIVVSGPSTQPCGSQYITVFWSSWIYRSKCSLWSGRCLKLTVVPIYSSTHAQCLLLLFKKRLCNLSFLTVTAYSRKLTWL